jgi:predicted  nucleic acid-binding Zn-ribbon protein
MLQTSASHSTLAVMIRTDFETPLKEMPSKIVAWRRIGDQDSSLEKTLKDYEKTSSKLEKASGKSKSSKADGLQNELQQLTQSLSSLSPMVYTTYQRLDEERLRGLKEVLIRWGTVRGDMATRDGERAENIVTRLIGWETQDEVLAVGRKLGGGGGGGSARGPASIAPSISASTTRE